MSIEHGPTANALHRLQRNYDESGAGMGQFMAAEAAGEQPDPMEFMRLVEANAVARRAMEAQFKLHEKPLKTVLSEWR